jgi:hypothetical protein
MHLDATLLEETTGKIRNILYDELTEEQKQNDCAICFDSFQQFEQIRELQCVGKHIFHQKCIAAWFDRNPVCPLCRTRM